MKTTKFALKHSLMKLYGMLRTEMQDKWQRDLPFEELLFDRWERAKNLEFGEKTSIYHNSYVYGKVKVGKNTWIGPLTLLDGTGGLEIGDYCNIASGVQIYTHNTVRWAVSGGKSKYEHKPVKIGDYCFIGPQSVIRDGITIGEHSIIGACSFVNKNVPPYSIVVGIPGKVIGKVEIDGEGVIFKYDTKKGAE